LDSTCIDLLVKAKANVNHQDKDGYACLHISIICGNSSIVKYLLKNGADINMVDSEMHSAIHWAVVCAHDQLFDLLIEKNADPESADIHGAYPIHYAAQMCGEIDIWDETLNRDIAKSDLKALFY
jgi:ankyrin repeat protein